MKKTFLTFLWASSVVLALTMAGCGDDPFNDSNSLTISPQNATMNVGETKQYTVYSNGANVTSSTSWETTTGCITMDYNGTAGLAYASCAGTVKITASYGGEAVWTDVTVETFSSISISPNTATISVGETQQYYATGHYSDSSTLDLTNLVSWASDDTSVATINSIGLASGAGAGTANITATYSGLTSNTAVLTVTGDADANDTIGIATLITAGVDAAVTGAISTASDLDYYKIVSGCTGTITVSMTGLSADLDVKLFDPSQTEVAVSYHSGNSNESIIYDAGATGTYYIKVYPYSTGTSSYTLTVFVPPCEPNYSFSAASAVEYPSTTSGAISSSSDADYYKFYVSSAGTITVDLTGLSGEIDVILYDSTYTQKGSSTNGGTANEQIVVTTTAGGTYYLDVVSLTGDTGNYTLYVH